MAIMTAAYRVAHDMQPLSFAFDAFYARLRDRNIVITWAG
jgi:hypothetical protein